LPSGARVELEARERPPAAPRARAEGEPLFSEALAVLESRAVIVKQDGREIDPRALPLADFHLLRAALTKHGYVAEEEIDVACANCKADVMVSPCRALELGPWIDGELGDEELDAVLPIGEPQPIPPVPLGRVRMAKTITFRPRTVAEAAPLFAALAAEELDVDAAVVRAMGIEALGPERDPERIARALATCDDEAFRTIGDAFVQSHYPPRMSAIAFCPACRARNDVEAPFEREFDPGGEPAAPRVGAEFPSFDAFAGRAEALFAPLAKPAAGANVLLFVEGGTPAVDDGGAPLLGAYDPPTGDPLSPATPPRVTLFYRTFEDAFRDDPSFDWEDELRETIEHELEHHVYFLRGADPMDDEEREAIREEERRVVGGREAERRALSAFGSSVVDFLRRGWPLLLIALLALLIALLSQR
jgi:hypothetical protein